jgi:hypothetical protein
MIKPASKTNPGTKFPGQPQAIRIMIRGSLTEAIGLSTPGMTPLGLLCADFTPLKSSCKLQVAGCRLQDGYAFDGWIIG